MDEPKGMGDADDDVSDTRTEQFLSRSPLETDLMDSELVGVPDVVVVVVFVVR